MTEEEYWAALKACGIVRTKAFTRETWEGSSREERPIMIEDPAQYTPEEREAMVEKYRQRYAGYDC